MDGSHAIGGFVFNCCAALAFGLVIFAMIAARVVRAVARSPDRATGDGP
jgi:hypothetical protein